MSMIDCTVRVERKAHPKGDRVLLTFELVLCINLVLETSHALFAAASFCLTQPGKLQIQLLGGSTSEMVYSNLRVSPGILLQFPSITNVRVGLRVGLSFRYIQETI